MKKGMYVIGIVILFLLISGSAAFYTVDQTEYAVIVEFGKPVRLILEPGLYIKIPFIQQAMYFDNRVLEHHTQARILTNDKKDLVVNSCTKWRIKAPLEFYKTARNQANAISRIDDIIYSQLRVELGRHTLNEIISDTRGNIMKKVTTSSNICADDYGIEVVDVRIEFTDSSLPKPEVVQDQDNQ